MKTFLIRLLSELKNPIINKQTAIIEIEKQEQTELLKNIKFQLQSPTFLREWCIDEVQKEIEKLNK
jgi:hypothetical protein